MSVFFSPRRCDDPCPPSVVCGGSWNAAQARLNWHGWEGFLSDKICGGCKYGGTKYLSRHLSVAILHAVAMGYWAWEVTAGIGAWVAHECSESYGAHNDNTTTVDRRSGCPIPSGSYSSPPYVSTCGGCAPGENGLAFLLPASCNTGGGQTIDFAPVDIWSRFDYHCNQYIGIQDPCNNAYYTTGDFSGIAGCFPTAVVTQDTVTDTHIGFSAVLEIHNSPQWPSPPSGDGTIGQVVCGYTDISDSIVVSVTLGTPYSFDDLVSECVTLLNNWPLTTTPFHDGPGPCSPVPLLTYDNGGCCTAANVPLGTTCAYDGHVIGAPGGIPQFVSDGIQYGAFIRFDPVGDSGAITIQKWAQRQRNFRQYGWQDTPPRAKLWNYLFTQYTLNFCPDASPNATYSCSNNTGADEFVMCLSPNVTDVFTNGLRQWASSPFPEGGGERTNGSMWQGICRDVVGDTWPASDPSIYIEPNCGRDCPDATACGMFLVGCPNEPDPN